MQLAVQPSGNAEYTCIGSGKSLGHKGRIPACCLHRMRELKWWREDCNRSVPAGALQLTAADCALGSIETSWGSGERTQYLTEMEPQGWMPPELPSHTSSIHHPVLTSAVHWFSAASKETSSRHYRISTWMGSGFAPAIASVFSSSHPAICLLQLPMFPAAVLILLSDGRGWFLPFLTHAAGFWPVLTWSPWSMSEWIEVCRCLLLNPLLSRKVKTCEEWKMFSFKQTCHVFRCTHAACLSFLSPQSFAFPVLRQQVKIHGKWPCLPPKHTAQGIRASEKEINQWNLPESFISGHG